MGGIGGWWEIAVNIAEILTASGVVVALFLSYSANKTAQKALDLETRPYLKIRDVGEPTLDLKSVTAIPEKHVQIAVCNVGKGVATITALRRCWDVSDFGEYPSPVVSGRSSYKRVHLTIGPGEESLPLDAYFHLIRDKALKADSWISFMCRIEFKDAAERRYEAGFLLVYRMDRHGQGLHLGLPDKGGEQYNYHQELPRSSMKLGRRRNSGKSDC